MSKLVSFFCAVLGVDYSGAIPVYERSVGTRDDLTAIAFLVQVLNQARNIDSFIIECLQIQHATIYVL